jgi:hypothetical protein
VGGALGLAVLATLATERTDGLFADGESTAVALNSGYHLAFLLGATLIGVAVVVAVVVANRSAKAPRRLSPPTPRRLDRSTKRERPAPTRPVFLVRAYPMLALGSCLESAVSHRLSGSEFWRHPAALDGGEGMSEIGRSRRASFGLGRGVTRTHPI